MVRQLSRKAWIFVIFNQDSIMNALCEVVCREDDCHWSTVVLLYTSSSQDGPGEENHNPKLFSGYKLS